MSSADTLNSRAYLRQMHLIIPSGTKVVSRHDRRVGFVVHAPASLDGLYRCRRKKIDGC